ncbi:MAG: hypothetical protein ACI351_03920 [Candidatus Avelusimicrobium sp.]
MTEKNNKQTTDSGLRHSGMTTSDTTDSGLRLSGMTRQDNTRE